MQVLEKEQQTAKEALLRAAGEIDEMHGLLVAHRQRIPTVHTVRVS